MAFDKDYLSLMAVGGGKVPMRLWSYTTDDPIGTVNSDAYMNAAVSELNQGDIIYVRRVDSLTAPTAFSEINQVVVVSNDGTDVDLSDGQAISVTDTD